MKHDAALVERLGGRLSGLRGRLTANAEMDKVTWFRAGGPAELLFQPADEDDLSSFLNLLPEDVPVMVVGVGSNLLVREGGIPGVVIRLSAKGFGDVAVWLVFSYLWLQYMILPVYAGFDRIPDSLLEASADLGGHAWVTFRRVILPLVLPAVVAGSIFTFSLTLGDYIVPTQMSTSIFIGNAIYGTFGAGNLPLAAALSLMPLAIVIVYLLVARRLGAFEAL